MPRFLSVLTRAAALLLMLAPACRASDTYTVTFRGHVGPAYSIRDPDRHLDATLVAGAPVQVTVILPYPAQSTGGSLDDLTYPFPRLDAGAPATWGITATFGDYTLRPGPHPAGSSLEVVNAPAHSLTGALDQFLVTQDAGVLTGKAAGAPPNVAAFTLGMRDTTGEVFSTAALPLHLDPSAFDVRWMQLYLGYDGAQPALFSATIDTAVVSLHRDGEPRLPEARRPPETHRLSRIPLAHVRPDFLLGEMRRALVPAGGGLLPPGVSAVVPNAQDGSLLADATPGGLAALRRVVRLLDVPARAAPAKPPHSKPPHSKPTHSKPTHLKPPLPKRLRGR